MRPDGGGGPRDAQFADERAVIFLNVLGCVWVAGRLRSWHCNRARTTDQAKHTLTGMISQSLNRFGHFELNACAAVWGCC
jgi:hypothetical protein